MTQQVKALIDKYNDLSLISVTQVGERKQTPESYPTLKN